LDDEDSSDHAADTTFDEAERAGVPEFSCEYILARTFSCYSISRG